jgi:hypothetical protein
MMTKRNQMLAQSVEELARHEESIEELVGEEDDSHC